MALHLIRLWQVSIVWVKVYHIHIHICISKDITTWFKLSSQNFFPNLVDDADASQN